MSHKNALISEGEALDGLLDELQRKQEIAEIAGWDCGFAKLNRALDGILPGFYSLVGPPGSGRTSFAKQLLDQVAMRNDIVGIFFSFIESKREIRIKTLARLSGIENREIRRGSAYLLHWYGVPRLAGPEAEQLSPSWEKLRRCAENARHWLSSIYLVECRDDTNTEALQAQVCEIRAATNKQKIMIVIDDCHRLSTGNQTLQTRVLLTQQLCSLVKNLNAALLAVWPSAGDNVDLTAQTWIEGTLGADVVMVFEEDAGHTKTSVESAQATHLQIVKNRYGARDRLSFDFHPAFAKFSEGA
jgi:replicative DNA helicase